MMVLFMSGCQDIRDRPGPHNLTLRPIYSPDTLDTSIPNPLPPLPITKEYLTEKRKKAIGTATYLNEVLFERIGLSCIGRAIVDLTFFTDTWIIEPIDKARTFKRGPFTIKLTADIDTRFRENSIGIDISF